MGVLRGGEMPLRRLYVKKEKNKEEKKTFKNGNATSLQGETL